MKLLVTTCIFHGINVKQIIRLAKQLCNVSLNIPNLHDNNHYEKHVGSGYLNNFEDL